MQVRQSRTPTGFFADDPYARPDSQNDARFYEKARLVKHIDDQADAIISGLYGSLLKPGGYFIHTFSNRWFPPKVVRIWTELLEWERPGLVLEDFLLNGAFDRLHTLSARGCLRPVSDRNFPQVPVSDPVYAVWGQTRG